MAAHLPHLVSMERKPSQGENACPGSHARCLAVYDSQDLGSWGQRACPRSGASEGSQDQKMGLPSPVSPKSNTEHQDQSFKRQTDANKRHKLAHLQRPSVFKLFHKSSFSSYKVYLEHYFLYSIPFQDLL